MNKNKLAGILLAAIFLPALHSQAQTGHPDPDIRKDILGAPILSTIGKVREIPEGVLTSCHFELANPTEPFQATDCITDKKLLDRRLIWGALTPKYVILHYEQGGRGHSYHILILSKDGGNHYQIVWKAFSIRFDKYNDFRNALAEKAINDPGSQGF